MTVLPALLAAPAKLTLSLKVTGVREDGYHLIDAEMVSLDLHDDIELTHGSGVEVVGGTGLAIPPGADNLVSGAFRLLGLHAHARITKRIPAGAGLGGGSADAASILAWGSMFDPLRAVELGADVAFCLIGGRARVRGIGEKIEQLDAIEASYTLLTPPFGVSTPLIYRTWDELGGPRGDHGNDLEPAAVAAMPELEDWRDGLWELTGTRPRLAGSGGTWFVQGRFDGIVRDVATRVVNTAPARVLDP